MLAMVSDCVKGVIKGLKGRFNIPSHGGDYGRCPAALPPSRAGTQLNISSPGWASSAEREVGAHLDLACPLAFLHPAQLPGRRCAALTAQKCAPLIFVETICGV